MGLGETSHLLFDQGSQSGNPQMESSWQIILFGLHSFWKIGIFHIKIHLSGFFLKIRWSGNSRWQFFCMAKSSWIWATTVLFRWACHWVPPVLYCLKFSSLQSLLGHLTPDHRKMRYYSNHLSLNPHCTPFGRSFLCLMFGASGCVLLFSFFSRWIFFSIFLFELFGVTISV